MSRGKDEETGMKCEETRNNTKKQREPTLMEKEMPVKIQIGGRAETQEEAEQVVKHCQAPQTRTGARRKWMKAEHQWR